MSAGGKFSQGPNGHARVVEQKAANHSGTMLGLLIHWPGSWRLLRAITELCPSRRVGHFKAPC